MGMFKVFVMYSNSVRSFSTLRVKYFVTVATYGVITHLVEPALKGNQKGPSPLPSPSLSPSLSPSRSPSPSQQGMILYTIHYILCTQV